MNRDSYYLTFVIITLLLYGLIMVYSASVFQTIEGTRVISAAIFKKQVTYVALGTVLFMIAALIDFRHYEKWTYFLYLITIVTLILLFTPLGHKVNGATRWLRFNMFNLQPSEFAKITIIIYLAHSLSKKNIKLLKQFYVGVLPHILFTGIIILLILVQPDFGTAALISMMLIAMMVLAGVKWRDVLLPSGVLLFSGYLLIIFSPYRAERFKAFLDPFRYRQTSGYQLVESLLAFGSGGGTGVGLGNSFQKRFYLPEAHTDFIAAIIGEELGFIGIATLLILYILLFLIGLKIALKAKTLFGTYVAFGISFLLFVQALLNLGVVSGGFPTKGLTLPFISFGGSSILATMIMMGILLNISRSIDDDPPLVKYKIDPKHS